MTEGTRIAQRSAFDGMTFGSSRLRFSVGVAAVACRFSVRIAFNAQHARGAVGGLDGSLAINRWSGTPERLAMRLGPDEWLVVGPQADGEAIRADLDQALAASPHAVVDVSHRQATLILSGPDAANVLNTGCPLDLHEASFPTGTATRTLFHKAEIVLARIDDAPTYRVDVARSFVPYVAALIEEAALAG